MKLTGTWDVFISHASSDKMRFVLPVAEALKAAGVSVWLDNWAIDLGASITASITEGLKKCRFGIVVLSRAFFASPWAQRELAALIAADTAIIPIWYDVGRAEVLEYAPLLADRMAARSEDGIPTIAARIVRLVAVQSDHKPAITQNDVRALTLRLFPTLGVDDFWQMQMLADLDRSLYRSVNDIALAYRRARPAVETYAFEQPLLFRTGTDYLTKALGFVDLCFRFRHRWAPETSRAFLVHAAKVDWEIVW